MDLIYDILKRLKKQEIRQIRHTFKTSSFSYEKVGKLFELVTRFGEKEEVFFAKKLYKKEPDNTFRVTKSRLKRMLENILLQDKSLTSNKSAAINASDLARKKLLQGRVLIGRGAFLAGKNIINQVINSAKKYHLHDELFDAQLLLYRNLSAKTSVREHQNQTKVLLELNKKRALVNECVILHHSVSNLLFNRSLKKASIITVREQINRMKTIAEETKHPLATNYYYLSETYFYQATQKPVEARSFCELYLALLIEDEALFTPVRLAGAYLQLAQITAEQGDLMVAAINAKKAMERLPEKSINHLLALEMVFRIAFHNKEWQEVTALIHKAQQHPDLHTSKNLAAKWKYFEACLLFRTDQFKDAYMALNETTPLLADKFGINIAVRMLDIMIMYEMDKMDLLESKILNMRQFVKRTQKDIAQQRAALLVRLLLGWYRKNYDFKETIVSYESDLKSNDPERSGIGWGTSTYELIPLDLWLQEKAFE